MKILHIADIHFNEKLLKEINKCMEYVVEIAKKEKLDLICIAGDLFDSGVILGSYVSLQAFSFISQLGELAPVLIIRGTNTHDIQGAINPFSMIKARYQIKSTEDIGIFFMKDKKIEAVSNLDDLNKADAIIFSFPSLKKGDIIDEIVEKDIEKVLNEKIFIKWRKVCEHGKFLKIPTIFVGHGTIKGAQASTGQYLTGQDIEWSVDLLKDIGCDVYCLGHIHKNQSWGNIFYSGSITRLNYGEEEEKGFYVHEIENGNLISNWYKTPARIIKTKRYKNSLPTNEDLLDIQQGDFVRLVYEVHEEDIHKIDEEALKKYVLDKGAAEIKIEKIIIPKFRLRAEGISKILNLEDKFKKWAEITNVKISEKLLEKINLLTYKNPDQESYGF